MNALAHTSTTWSSAQAEANGISEWLDVDAECPTPVLARTQYGSAAVIYGRRGGMSEDRLARATALDCALLGRRSGGGAVLAGPWLLGLHLWLPADHAQAKLFPIPSLFWFGSLIAECIASLGGNVRLADAHAIEKSKSIVANQGLDWSCFAGISHGELLDEQGRKVVGLSQARVKRGVLLSGGLVCAPVPWALLERIHLGTCPSESHKSPMLDLVNDGQLFNSAGRCEALWQRLQQRLASVLFSTDISHPRTTHEPALLEL